MYVSDLELRNFRNYMNLSVELNKGLNIFLGENAQGKTNIAEAIYFLSSLRSHRTSREKDMINWNRDKSYIKAKIHNNTGAGTIEFLLSANEKRGCKINGVNQSKPADIYGTVNVVMFSPEDLKLVKEGPQLRRRFIDLELNQLRPKYSNALSRYNHVLLQRNNILKTARRSPSDRIMAEVFSEQLADYGSFICEARHEFIKKLSMISRLIHRKITDGGEELDITYLCSSGEFANRNTTKELLLEHYIDNIEEDLEKGFTTKGPHRDDLDIRINGIDTKVFGSQGQQRTAALSLKLSELEIIKSEVHEYPVLILDDVLSELDIRRQKFLLDSLKDIQTILTCTSLNDINQFHFEEKDVFMVENGKISRVDRLKNNEM